MCSILRVLEGSGRLNLSYLTCLEGSGRLNLSYFTCLEAQNVDKFVTFARGWDGRLWEATCVAFYVSGSSRRLNQSYFTRLEAQNVDKFITFARFREAQAGSTPW